MGTLCRNVQEAIEESVYEPVQSWVNKQSEKCKRKKWWNPASWFCWLIWILVKVVTWILITVITMVTKVVCTLVSFVAHIVLVAVGSIIDAFCEDCHVVDFANSTFGSEGKCKLEGKTPSVDKPQHFDYVFICKCKKQSFKITVTAMNDEIASELVRTEKMKKCGITPKIGLVDAMLDIDNMGNSIVIYHFECTCKQGGFPTLIKVPTSIEDVYGFKNAEKLAKLECRKQCS